MAIAAGTRLGHYQIHHELGAGGMGVVYQADDARLGRKVAIKVLPKIDEENLKRFEREARTTGGLNHPNLVTLYDIGEHEGTPYLVTELLAGQTLAERLAGGKLRLREAVHIAADVARGLAAAHEANVIHRDVKPANIFLTSDGRTKILDFGIAKLMPVPERPSRVNLATATTAATATTETGTMIGTPGYMAPEQLDGDRVDARTDIFALGVVLYEMITGERAFYAPNAIEESYAILKHTPPPPDGATQSLARVVLRCLEKKPESRFQSARDLAFALDELDASTDPVAKISATEIPVTPPPTGARKRPRGRMLAPVLAAAIPLAAIAGLAGGRLTAKSAVPATTERWPSYVEGGPAYRRVTYHSQTRWSARLARDGKSALYSGYRDGRTQVMRSLVGQPSIVSLDIEGRLLDISPRGELAVVKESVPEDGGALFRIVEGGGPRALTDHVTAASWLPDGDSLAIVRDGLTLELPIGTPIVQRKTGWIDLMRVSPAGDRIAFVEHGARGDTAGRVVIVDRTGKEVAASSHHIGIEGLAWSGDATEVWFSNSATIHGVDLRSKERVVLNGAPGRLVLVDVVGTTILVAPTDLRLKMFTGPRTGPYREVSWFDSSDVESVSRDGSAIAFVEASGQTANGYPLFVRQGDHAPSQFAQGYRAALLPDGSAALVLVGEKRLDLVPTGMGTTTPLALGPIEALDIGDSVAISWQGTYAVVRGTAGGESKLWRVDVSSPTKPPTMIPTTSVSTRHPISPDGSMVAVAREAGGVELVVVATGAVTVIEGPPGETPVGFTGDGTALFVTRIAEDSLQVDRIDLATRARTSWLRATPEQRPVYHSIVLDASGEHVTYSTNSDASDLYVLEPAKARQIR